MKLNVGTQRHGTGSRIRRLELSALILGCTFWIYACSPEPKTPPDAATNEGKSVLEVPRMPDVEPGVSAATANSDEPLAAFTGEFVKFQHGSSQHTRLPCLLCHNRADNSSRIGFPGKVDHLPCAGCHTLQFADQTSPICAICHTNSQTGAMKGFPGLRSFGVKFDHARHRRTNCVTCHKPEGRGVIRSIPSGSSAHTTCFQCHSSKLSFSMSSCGTCHQPGRLVRTPEWTRAFRVGFSHAKHIGGENTNCATCHTVRAGAARGKQVSSPLASVHFASSGGQSCASCHNGTKTFGPDDFSNCKRCHQEKTFKF